MGRSSGEYDKVEFNRSSAVSQHPSCVLRLLNEVKEIL